jgi:polyhydroxyalkanoate synthesis regulator phasin
LDKFRFKHRHHQCHFLIFLILIYDSPHKRGDIFGRPLHKTTITMELFTKENFSKLAYMALGAVVSNESKIRVLVDEWIEKGKMTEEDGKKFYEEMLSKTREAKSDFESKVKEISESWYATMHVATTEQLTALEARLAALEAKIS